MSNLVKSGNCMFEYANGKCPFGKPVCTSLCDYKAYISKFLFMGVEWDYVIRFFKMYRRWQKIYWEKYILPG